MKFFLIIFCLFTSTIYCYEIEKENSFTFADEVYSSTECYTIIKPLGEGFWGKVFAVEDSKKQQFALKSYKRYGEYENAELLTCIQDNAEREYQRGQLLDHPNIIKVFDVFFYHSLPNHSTYNIVLQLVDGKTLSEISKGALLCQQVTDAIIQLIGALRYALSFDLIHQDLNEVNIMLDKNAQIMLIDLASFYTFDEYLAIFQNIKNIKNDPDSNDKSNRPLVYSFYFDQISEICVKIIAKSDLDRQEKIKMHTEIKKISWNCSEDVDEGKFTSLDDYFEKLFEVIRTI